MHESKDRTQQPPAGALKRLKHDGQATAAELREFLAQVRGKRPQEVMGTIASSSLVKSTLLAAVGISLFLLFSSAVAYVVTPDKSKTAKTNTNQATQAKTDSAKTDGLKTPGNQTADTTGQTETITSGDKTLETLGVGETKIAPPEKNPLEDKFNDLLDKKID
jgi:hypothetical protein